MVDLKEKIYAIAKEFNELNKYGEVKSFSGNEKGYAKILQIKPGCSIWAHHTLNDQLIIDLITTEKSQLKYPDFVEGATDKFKAFFKQKAITKEWRHSIDEYKSLKHYVNITETPIEQILQTIKQLRKQMTKIV